MVQLACIIVQIVAIIKGIFLWKKAATLASLAVLGIGFFTVSTSNVQAAEQNRTGFVRENGKVYFIENGQKVRGWKSIEVYSDDKTKVIDKTWVYLNELGESQTGWIKDNGTWYYFDGSGAMKEN